MLEAAVYAQPRYDSSVFKPQRPKSGDTVQLEYDAKNKDLEFSDEVQAALFIYDNFRWKREVLSMEKDQQGLWRAAVPVTATTVLVGVKFFQGDANKPDAFDNNGDKGYAVTFIDTNRVPLAGAYLAEAAFQQPIIARGGMFGYYAEDPKSLEEVYLQALAEKARALSSKQYLRDFEAFMKLQELALGDGFPVYARGFIIDNLGDEDVTDEALGIFYTYASARLKDTLLSEDIAKRVARDFPKGATARFIAFNSTKGSSPDRKEIIASYEDFLRRFPVSEWRTKNNRQDFIYYTVYRGIGAAYFESKQFDKFISLYDEIDFRTGNELMRWNIMRAYMFKMVGLDTLYDVAEAIMPKFLSRKDDNSYINDFQNKAFADSNMMNQLDDRLFTHISLLYDLEKYDEARKYFFELSERGRYRNADLNEINMQVLVHLGDEKQILPLLEMSMRVNAMTPKMLDKLKDIYLQQHNGNAEGYETYLASLKSEEEQQQLKAYIEEHLVHKSMPDFNLEAAEGHHVRLADWKGKIVVVDFWATWCRPCIMAFPGMQLLVDKYQKDPQVEIYMLGTMMEGDYKEKSEGFVRREGYRFNQLLDAIDPTTGKQDLLFKQMIPTIFEDSSIPRKIVLKDGVVRYASGGYSGSPSKLVDELSSVIELLRNEK